MGLDFCSEAIVFNGDKIFLRGVKECVDKDMELFIQRHPEAESYITFYPLEIGMSKEEVTEIVHYIIDHPDSDVSGRFRRYLEQQDMVELNILEAECRAGNQKE